MTAPACLGCQRMEVATRTLPDGTVVCDRCPALQEAGK